MRTVLVLAILSSIFIGAGCQQKAGAQYPGKGDEPAKPASTSSRSDSSPDSAGGGVTPMAGVGAGSMTPVTGTENLQGGGSAAGQVMKDRARGLANTAPSSLNQMGDE